MKKTVYVRPEDVKVFEQAEAMGDERSLSTVIAEALRRWIGMQGGGNRLDVIAKQAIEYLDGAQQATVQEIAEAVGAEVPEVEKALTRENRQARQWIASCIGRNYWFEQTYPVDLGGSWELRFQSLADEEEE